MLGDELLAVVDAELAVQGQADGDQVTGQLRGDAVAIAAGLDVGIPADLPTLPVRRVVASCRQRPEGGRLPDEALRHHLVDRPVDPLIGFLAEPLLGGVCRNQAGAVLGRQCIEQDLVERDIEELVDGDGSEPIRSDVAWQ